MLLEKSKSKSQQRFMGMVHAYQKGKLKTQGMDKEMIDKVKSAAKGMSNKEVKTFAKTKHERLPEKINKNESIITKFDNFNESKKKDVGKTLRKGVAKRQRDEQLKSGASLKTKVVPDKKKKYNRQKEKKVIEESIKTFNEYDQDQS